ncbi:hypothetical protein L4C54_12920 [Vibrio lamellibrachiae]|uniref:hypothetical protein n=1 Tax=Vibrio lamellibrachiae TaxID=2910253 RepID=UPI003D09EF81
MVEIIDATFTTRGAFTTSTSNTGKGMREKQHETLKNLASVLGHTKIYKRLSARSSYFYSLRENGIYQSASNLIMDLSKEIAQKYK